MRRGGSTIAPVLTLIALSSPAMALAAANYAKPGFFWPEMPKPTILVAYPDVKIHRQGPGGVEILDADWTRQARDNLTLELQTSGIPAKANLQFMTEVGARSSPDYETLLATYHRRIGEIIFSVPQGTPDVTKAKRCKCTYDFSDVKDRVTNAFGPADYVLIMNQYDTYATAGQILGEIAGATVVGAVTPQSSVAPMRRMRPHFGNAIMFDLRSGEVVWMHGDGAFGGDLRKPETARVRVRQALSGFPGLR
jgi:hypothetical protein